MRVIRVRLVGVAVGLVLVVACTGCGSKPDPTPRAECSVMMSVGATTYWGVHVSMPLGPRAVGRGSLSACADPIRPHHHTGMFVTTYEVPGFDPSEALVSPAGPGDPQTLWIATSDTGPPFVAPPPLQALIDDHRVPPWMRRGVN
jgi:hypothetical protein